jgi:hypothetical protein
MVKLPETTAKNDRSHGATHHANAHGPQKDRHELEIFTNA